MQKKASLSGSTAWYTVGNLFIRSISFILLPFYSNFIHPYNFGQYSLILSAYAIISVLYQFGMQNSLFKFYIEEPDSEKKKAVFSTVFSFISILGIIFSFVIFIFSEECSRMLLGSANEYVLIRLAVMALFFDNLNYFFLQLLKTNEQPKKVVLYSALSALISLFLNIYFVYGRKMAVTGILTAQMISNIALFLMMFWEVKGGLPYKLSPGIIKKLLKFSFPFLIGGFFTVGVNVIDRFFLSHYMGEEKVGVYSFSYRIAMIMNVFVFSLGSAWIPYAMRRYKEGNFYEDFGKSLTKILAFSLLIFVTVSLLVDDLFSLQLGNGFLFDHKYFDGIIIIPVVLIGYMFNILVNYFSLYPYVSGKSYHFVIADGMAFLINITSNIFLIPFFGIMGAAVATLLSFAASLLYLMIVSSKQIKIKYEPNKIFTLLVITGIVFVISFWLNKFFIDFILIGFITLLFYKISGLRLKIFE